MPRSAVRILRLRWRGALPQPGAEYVRPPRTKSVLRIERVIRSTEPTRGGAPIIEIHGRLADPPEGATIHDLEVQRLRDRLAERDAAARAAATAENEAAKPVSRPPAPSSTRRRDSGAKRLAMALAGEIEDSDPSVPEKTRLVPRQQRISGKAVRAEWDDPADKNDRGTRRARQTSGYIRADPVRALKKRNDLITDQHVAASDKYKALWERGPGGARSAPGDRLDRVDVSPGPGSADPTMAAMQAMRRWIRVQEMFDGRARALLEHVVLQGNDVSSWASRNGFDRKMAVGLLIGILDVLVAYFGLHRAKTIPKPVARVI